MRSLALVLTTQKQTKRKYTKKTQKGTKQTI